MWGHWWQHVCMVSASQLGRKRRQCRGRRHSCRPHLHALPTTALLPPTCAHPCPLSAHHPPPTTRRRHARPSSGPPLALCLQGVELTHKNVLATIASMNAFVDAHDVHLSQDDVFLSFLPLAHIFDRRVHPSYPPAAHWLPAAAHCCAPRPPPPPRRPAAVVGWYRRACSSRTAWSCPSLHR